MCPSHYNDIGLFYFILFHLYIYLLEKDNKQDMCKGCVTTLTSSLSVCKQLNVTSSCHLQFHHYVQIVPNKTLFKSHTSYSFHQLCFVRHKPVNEVVYTWSYGQWNKSRADASCLPLPGNRNAFLIPSFDVTYYPVSPLSSAGKVQTAMSFSRFISGRLRVLPTVPAVYGCISRPPRN